MTKLNDTEVLVTEQLIFPVQWSSYITHTTWAKRSSYREVATIQGYSCVHPNVVGTVGSGLYT